VSAPQKALSVVYLGKRIFTSILFIYTFIFIKYKYRKYRNKKKISDLSVYLAFPKQNENASHRWPSIKQNEIAALKVTYQIHYYYIWRTR
jgi:hypothetical protein